LDQVTKGSLGGSTAAVVDRIIYPETLSEFEVQCYIYLQLSAKGVDVRGEVSTLLGRVRFDLVIFDDNRTPELIIEVKRRKLGGLPRKVNKRNSQEEHRQVRKYERFGIPVKVIHGRGHAITFCHEYLKSRNAKPHNGLQKTFLGLREKGQQ
jgi:hypothetical protein